MRQHFQLIRNPELLRNLWTELSPLRLILIPTLIAGILFAISEKDRWQEDSFFLVGVMAFASHYILATQRAARAIRDEIKENTWDFQRMSSISPWALAFGKLFGATSYNWLWTLTLTAIYLYCGTHIYKENLQSPEALNILIIVPVFFILCGYLGQCVAFLVGLQNTSERGSDTFFASLLGFIAGSLSFLICTKAAGNPEFLNQLQLLYEGPRSQTLLIQSDQIAWHGIKISALYFCIASLYFFLLWAQIGIYRSMLNVLQYRISPVAWFAFLITFIIYITGFIGAFFESPAMALPAKTFIAYLIFICTAYMGGFSWANYMLGYKRFFYNLKNGNLISILKTTPPWVASAIGAVIFFVVTIGLRIDTNGLDMALLNLMLGVSLLAARDIFVFHAIFMPGAVRHTGLAVITYLFLLYVLGPVLIKPLKTGNWGYLVPSYNADFQQAVLYLLVEAILAGGLFLFSLKYSRKKAQKEDL